MEDSPLKAWTEREGRLLRLGLARPKANLIDAEMIAALNAALDGHRSNAGLCGVLLDHEGPHFSFGASVQEHLPGQVAAMLKALHGLICRMVKLLRATTVGEGAVLLTGGLALDEGLFAAVRECIEEQDLRVEAKSHPDSIYAGAIGAGIWDAFRYEKLARLGQLAAAS